MPDYKVMYFKLFNAITDVVSNLQTAQQNAEESYIESENPALTILFEGDKPDPASTSALKKKRRYFL